MIYNLKETLNMINNKNFLLLITLFLSCQIQNKQRTFTEDIINTSTTSPKDQIEKLLPHIKVSQSKRGNAKGIKECIIEVALGNSLKKIDGFFPSYINRKELIYCDLAKNPAVINGIIEVEDLKKELYPKQYGKLLNIAFATTVEERLYLPINRYCVFINDSFLIISKDEVNDFTAPAKDTVKDFQILFKRSLSSIIDEIQHTTSK